MKLTAAIGYISIFLMLVTSGCNNFKKNSALPATPSTTEKEISKLSQAPKRSIASNTTKNETPAGPKKENSSSFTISPEVQGLRNRFGDNFNAKNGFGETPLFQSVVLMNDKNYQITKLLLENGADPNIPNNKGWTPLYTLTVGGTTELKLKFAELLLEYGANPNIPSNDGRTPLSSLVSFMKSELDLQFAQLLLENGADPDIPTDKGWTPIYKLTIADITELHLKFAKLLLENGADPKIPDNKGLTPFLSLTLGDKTELKLEFMTLLFENGAIDSSIKNKK